MTASRSRVLLIGLDMGDAGLVETWARRGWLPALGSLMREGASGRLGTTADILHTSTWPTIFTGALPGEHGVYYPYQPVPGVQEPRHVRPGQYGRPPLWQVLDQANKACVVIDAPETFPLDGFRGVQVFEWSTWAWYWKRMTQPRSLARELRRRFGRPPLRLEANRLGFALPDLPSLRSQLVASAAHKGALARWLMNARPWDFFAVTFCEPHAAGHYLWPAHMAPPSQALSLSADREQALARVRDVYVAVDRAIAGLLATCGDDVHVLAVSGDGVGPNHVAWHLLPEVLARTGFLARGTGAPGSDGPMPPPSLLRRARSLVPARLRWTVASRLPLAIRDRLGSPLTAGVAWPRTKAFCLPADLEGCIRLNLRGREPQGVVAPGRDYDMVCAAVADVLGGLINPATGKPAVAALTRVADQFPGARSDYLPDLTVRWNTDAEIRELHSDRLGSVGGAGIDPRTGTHHPVAFVALRGPDVSANPVSSGRHVVDIAPTVLTLLGVNPPSWMSGRPLLASDAPMSEAARRRARG
jgi:predicted AlkP superfamily phosphohydrolase/phosphomutase